MAFWIGDRKAGAQDTHMTDFQTGKLLLHLMWKLCCHASHDPAAVG